MARSERTARAIQEAIAWGAASWHFAGWFGLTSLIIGLAVSIGGAVWAVVIGVPAPIAVMAGYCTLAAAFCLTLLASLFRTSRIPQASEAPKSNYVAWRHLGAFELMEAANLWADLDPSSRKGTHDSHAWYKVLRDGIVSGELEFIAKNERIKNYEQQDPSINTKITKQALIAFANKRELQLPRFLRD